MKLIPDFVSKNTPLVTVGVASYNNACFIEETLDSIANQTYKNIELIINDDASTDNSAEIIENWIKTHSNLNIIFLKSEVNEGICKSGNKILSVAKGKYISLIGSDDRYLPAFFEKRVQFLEKTNNDIGFCYSLTYVIDIDGKRYKVDERPTPSGYIFEYLASVRNSLCKPFTCLIKAECFKTVGFYDENLFYEDLDWFYRVAKLYKVQYFSEIDSEFRVVPGSLGSKLNTPVGIISQLEIYKKNLSFSSIADKHFKEKIKRLCVKSYKTGFQSVSRKVSGFYISYFKEYKFLWFYMITFIPVEVLRGLKNLLKMKG